MNRLLATRTGIFARASGWSMAATAFAVAVVVLLVCYWQTVESLVWVWGHDGTYQYAFLIFPLSLWVAFDLRRKIRASSPVPSVWGLVALGMLAFVWYAGHLLDINLPQHFAFVAMFPALVLACWGWRALGTLMFPLGYLLVFAVPWGDGLVGPLQDITARIAVHALELTGTPVLLNGREILTPTATWMVADACSGVKFFIACTALGCLYAYLMYQRTWKRILFVVLAAVVPIIANGLRVYFTVLIGETFGLKYATGTDHMLFGWQFFGTVLVLLLLVGWFFRDRPTARQLPTANDDKLSGKRIPIWPAALVLLVAAPVLAIGLALPASAPTPHLNAPTLAGWLGPQPGSDNWRPAFMGAAGEVHAAYRQPASGHAVELFHAVYTGRPRRGHTLITYGNDVYDSEQARILASATWSVDLANRTRVRVRELRLAEAGGSRLVWYWYCVDHRCTASPILTKLLQAWDVLRGHMPRSSVWALSSSIVNGNIGQSRTSLRDFVEALPMAAASKPRVTRSADVPVSGP